MATREPILVINAGSSSIKFSLFENAAEGTLTARAHGQVEGIGNALRFDAADPRGRKLAAAGVARQ